MSDARYATSLLAPIPAGTTNGAMLDLIAETRRQLFECGSDDFKACLAAGVEMVCESESTDSGLKITMRTKNPCGVVWHGGKATVYQQRPE